MSWRDRLLPASFRGAEFLVDSHSTEAAGRRAAVHEYPGRDTPYAEDLGRRTGEYRIQGYVLGEDYLHSRGPDGTEAVIGLGAAPRHGSVNIRRRSA